MKKFDENPGTNSDEILQNARGKKLRKKIRDLVKTWRTTHNRFLQNPDYYLTDLLLSEKEFQARQERLAKEHADKKRDWKTKKK